MAILLLDELEASPNPTTLPKRVDFKQTVQSTNPGGETASFRYSMDDSHDVFFEDSDGSHVKEVTREDEISATEMQLHNRIHVVKGSGPAMATVQITETVIDSQGGEETTLTLLRIDS